MLEPRKDHSSPSPGVVSTRAESPRRNEPEGENVAVTDALYYRFFEQAERVRWRVTDIPWHELDVPAVSEYWKRIISEIARAELTAFEGTQSLMQRFGRNADFSQWLAVWFYEETKHPQALMMWLERVGVRLNSEFTAQGRSSPQLAATWLGTLTCNVIAELCASEAYSKLARHAPDPVLRHISQRIAADAARHAAHFFGYAQRFVACSTQPEEELKNALEVLYQWLSGAAGFGHPVACIVDSLPLKDSWQSARPFRSGPREDGLGTDGMRQRVCSVVGRMLGFSLASKSDVARIMRAFRARAPGD